MWMGAVEKDVLLILYVISIARVTSWGGIVTLGHRFNSPLGHCCACARSFTTTTTTTTTTSTRRDEVQIVRWHQRRTPFRTQACELEIEDLGGERQTKNGNLNVVALQRVHISNTPPHLLHSTSLRT